MTSKLTLDAYVKISFSNDKSVAYMEFNGLEFEEDFECTVELMEGFLRTQGITYGIQMDQLQKMAERPEAYRSETVTVACGTPAVPGTDGYIHYAVTLNDQNRGPLEAEDGKVNYKELVRLNNTLKGQLIAEKVDPLPGVEGTNVRGEPIPYKPGKEVRFKIGKNIVLNPEQTAIYAAIDGMISFTENEKINVFPVYEVNGDIDYHTGNIDFVGTVVIRGNVLSGFRVCASGDIRVVGGVEGAEIEAGGSIEITGGIIGYHKGLVKAAVDVKTGFIQDGNVQAGESVHVSQSIMHSNVQAGVSIHCDGPKGLIVGGHLQAGEIVVGRTIGNTAFTMTEIEVGVLPELRNGLVMLRQELKTHNENLDKTEKALSLLDQLAAVGQLRPDKMALRIKLSATRKSQLRERDNIRDNVLEIEKRLEESSKAKIEVLHTIYGGTKLVIGRYTKYIKDTAQRVSFVFKDGDIRLVPYH
ncbi:FapA family protein [Paenibacillus campi]|uniref:DUF342 domain-containing protein n=1 Tax=Paenibacillus campi TaxID=3106031 RepID=UPI002AFE68A7|nr:FapA family protein [Paenibacillus sp. SGZ-1009]